MDNPFIEVRRGENPEKIKSGIWSMLGLIRIYCKEIGKKPEKKAWKGWMGLYNRRRGLEKY